ncbi:MAG TPA: hypothetical protein VMJ12_02860 [Candidatus Acidoferrales bacterium]|nr:hypothetical protein [Candidatus Acidoferrales bacterium]
MDSSIAENYQHRHVFEDLLKLCDLNGVIDATPEAIARRTNVPLEIVKAGISELEKPDPKSRNPDHHGARIVRLDEHRDWGWVIVNYAYYRAIASEEQRRERTLVRVQRHREKAKRHVTACNASNAMQKQKQTEIDTVNLINGSRLNDLNKLTRFALKRIAREIVSNDHGWSYDNCKVDPANIVAASLVTVLRPFIGKIDEDSIHQAWAEAVRRAHGAVVDGVAKSAAKYCIGCFKDQLKEVLKSEP